MRITKCLLIWGLLTPQLAHAITNITVFTAMDTQEQVLDVIPQGVKLEIYRVDERQRLMDHMNNTLPFEQLKNMTEEERYQWSKETMRDHITAISPKVLSSTVGASIMRMYQIDRVPAVMIDDYYVIYGSTVSQAIRRYEQR